MNRFQRWVAQTSWPTFMIFVILVSTLASALVNALIRLLTAR